MKSPLDIHGTVVESDKFVYVSNNNHTHLHKIYVSNAYKQHKIHISCAIFNLPKILNHSKPNSGKDASAETLD